MDSNSLRHPSVQISDEETGRSSCCSEFNEESDGSGTEADFDSITIQNKLGLYKLVEDCSQKNLTKLRKDGEEFVSNIVVSSKNQEQESRCQREAHEIPVRKFIAQRKDHVKDSCNEVTSSWEGISNIKAPQELHEQLLSLGKKCAEILEEKDGIIERLKAELEEKRGDAALNRERCEEEVKLICQRIDRLISNLHKNGNNELRLIKSSLDDVHHEMMVHFSERLDNVLDKKEASNEKYNDFLSKIWAESDHLHKSLEVKYDELAAVRKQLSAEVHKFQMKLREVETNQFLNLDKLIYGLNILQKQVRENKLIYSELKRSYIRSFDDVLQLKLQLKKLNQEGEAKYQAGIDHCRQASDRLLASIKSAKCLHHAYKKNFSALFKQKESEARKLLFKILKVDRFVYEVLLKQQWQSPDLSFLEKKTTHKKTKDKELLERFQNFVTPCDEGHQSSDSPEVPEMLHGETSLRLKKPLDVEKLLVFICENTDFLINKQVLQLSKSVFPNMKTFIISNSIFNAMGIKSTDDLNMLLAYVLHHAEVVEQDELAVTQKSILIAFNDYIIAKKDKVQTGEAVFNIKPSSDIREQPEFWARYTAVLPATQDAFLDTIIFALRQYENQLEKYTIFYKLKAGLMSQNEELSRLFHHQLKDTGIVNH